MEKIIRYKNGTYFSTLTQTAVTLSYIRELSNFYVQDSETKKDITSRILFLAHVEYIKANDLYDRVSLTYLEDDK